MIQKRPWVLTFLGVLLVGLVGQMPVSAESGSYLGRALGAYAPDEHLGLLTFPDKEASAPDGMLAAGECDWATTYQEEVGCLINLARENAGLAPFKLNPILNGTAEAHSIYMRDHGCFSHQCPGELSVPARACAAGYGPYCWGDCYIGETIGAGYPTAADVVAAWLSSPSHREILLDGELREIGVGYASGGYWGYYWTVDYGSQPDVLPVAIDYDDPVTESREVTLTLSNEKVSGCPGIDYAGEVMISNDPNFAGAAWRSYSLHKSWTLADGNGEQFVYVRYRDGTGYTVTSSDVVLLDEPPKYQLHLGVDSVTLFYELGTGFSSLAQVPVPVENAAGDWAMSWYAQSGEGIWLSVSPESGTTPGVFDVSADEFEATARTTVQDTVVVTSPQDPDNPQQVTVTILAVDKVHRVMLPYVARAGD